MTSPSEIIREARNVLFEHGLTRGGLKRPDGVCMLGALGIAAGHGMPSFTLGGVVDYSMFMGGDDALRQAVDDAADAINPEWRSSNQTAMQVVHRFNDGVALSGLPRFVPEPSLDEVLDMLDRAEKIAETNHHTEGACSS